MNTYRTLQVQFNQGIVRVFLVEERVPLGVALDAIAAQGKFRSLRVQGTVDEAAAKLLVSTGNATKVEARCEEAKS